MDYKWNITYKQYQSKRFDHVIFILTINSLHNMIKYVSKKSTRAIAQLGRAPRLHARQCFFRGVHHIIKRVDLIEKSMSYSMTFREQNKRTIA